MIKLTLMIFFITFIAIVSTVIFLSTITVNLASGYDLDDVKSSISYEDAIDEFDLPANTKNFSMELDNGLIANYYLAPNQTYVFDGVSGAITEQNGKDDNGGDDKKKIKYYVDVTVTTTYKYPQTQDKPQDPRFDKKYDSIDWQDDNEEDNLTIQEMDKILEKQNDNNNNEEGSKDDSSSSNGQDGSGGSDSGGSDSGGSDSGGSDSGGSDSGGSDSS